MLLSRFNPRNACCSFVFFSFSFSFSFSASTVFFISSTFFVNSSIRRFTAASCFSTIASPSFQFASSFASCSLRRVAVSVCSFFTARSSFSARLLSSSSVRVCRK